MKAKLFLIICLLSSPVMAHSDGEQVYDYECCHQKDCGPVLKIEKAEGGDLMTTKHGTAFVKHNGTHKHRKAIDGRWHVCMRNPYVNEFQETPESKYMIPICVYQPQLY